MTTMIEQLREEHRDIEKLLLVLEEELARFERNELPDHKVIRAIICYFQDYPDCCHHPKEDMVFAKLKERDPSAIEKIGDLQAEHREEARRLWRAADMIGDAAADRDFPRHAFDGVMRDFIAREREHMTMEERVLFPAAANALRPEDWAEIDSRWNDEKDSLFTVAFDEKCRSLRSRVLRWESEERQARI